MRKWKDVAEYTYPGCQTIKLQSSPGKRFRLMLKPTKAACNGRRYDNSGNVIICDHKFVVDDIMVLRVIPTRRFKLQNQLRNLMYGDWHHRIPLLNKGAPLLEVATFCGMTPIGSVLKLRETSDGQNRGTQAQTGTEAGGEAGAHQASEGLRRG